VKPRAASDTSKSTTSVVEDYLQVLHYLTRDGCSVIAARMAERLNVSPPTVTATLQRMERDGLIEHGPRKEIVLTTVGRQAAENIVRRHALAERLLTDLLKMPWHESHEEAHGVEHVMTPKIEARLQGIASPFRTAEATGQDIIDPRETRPLLCEFVQEAQAVLRTQLGPTAVPYRP